jgi:flavin-dependent dehydrogenase
MKDVGEHTTMLPAIAPEYSQEPYDVAILGGGLAGLTLALQLKQARPSIRMLVIEKQEHPVPEAAFKVGESTVEIASHYLRNLGLQEYLETEQLIKYALRYFFSTDGNRDITRRVEFGGAILPLLDSYQLDRGRFENKLSKIVTGLGVTLLEGAKVQQVTLQPESDWHRVQVLHQGIESEIQARWVVDASGRSSLLKRQLGLAKKVEHAANAVWFRVQHVIDVDEWSDDPGWHGRIIEGRRWFSTNHLMGPGYWVWLIPLASGSTSIGIVTDARMHPFEKMNRFEWAMQWLHQHEPQCAAMIEQHRDQLQDFRVMKDFAYSCEQVFSSERWCLTGEAGVFLDPFYSPGSDMIAISNGLIGDLITRDLNGEDIEEQAAIHNQLFLLLTQSFHDLYNGQYPLMGNAQVMVAKIVWDTAAYWGVPALLYFHDKFPRVIDSPKILSQLVRFAALNERVQLFFREWLVLAQVEASDAFIRYNFSFLRGLHKGLAAGLSETELDARIAINVRFIEQLTGQLVSTVIEELARRSGDAAAQSQVQFWQADPLLMELVEIYHQENKVNPIMNSSWITLGQQLQKLQEVTR